jgi:Ca2+:H+ antiporter
MSSSIEHSPAQAVTGRSGIGHSLLAEWPLALSAGTVGLTFWLRSAWFAALPHQVILGGTMVWLVAVVMLSSFAVVRHAEGLAVKLGEPFGTLVLTIAVTGIEVMMITAVMSAGQGQPGTARDAMFSVVMIVLNGMVGAVLLIGGMKYKEQTYNLQGVNAFLSLIIPLAVLGLILPNFTTDSPGPTVSNFHAGFAILMSLGIYAVFLGIQTSLHRHYFVACDGAQSEGHTTTHGAPFHSILLVAYLLPLVMLSEGLAHHMEDVIHAVHGPLALGGLFVAVLVLSPESLTALRAAWGNELQRSLNILLGSVLATIGLTIPAVLITGLVTHQTIYLGLEAPNMILLSLTLVVSILTFSTPRTNILLGAVHLLMFVAYLMVMFEGSGGPQIVVPHP